MCLVLDMTVKQLRILQELGYKKFPGGYFHNNLLFHISFGKSIMRFEHSFSTSSNSLRLVIL